MGPLDINALIEKAKRNEAGAEASKAPLSPEATKEAEEVNGLLSRMDSALELEGIKEDLEKGAAQERRRNVTIAKLLTAADVFSGVGQ